MKNFFFAFAASLFIAGMATHAAADELSDCIGDVTMQCLEDDDFWGCLEVGEEFCENQHSSDLSAPEINKIKADSRRRAELIYKKSATKK